MPINWQRQRKDFIQFMNLISRVRGMTVQLALVGLMAGLAWPQNPCDLNQNGTVDAVDVQLAANMAIGAAPCTANVEGAGICNVAIVQRLVNTILGGTCHTAFLNWTASTSTGVVGYNVYRGGVSGGPYTKLTSSPVAAVNYVDRTVWAGQTYFYVVRAVDSGSTESVNSNQAQAVVPSP
jgi:hypothetical protein